MSNKRFYWLKLKEDFFEEDTISWIEEQENGKEYCLFYLKLCLKSLKTDGVLIRNVGEILVPYDAAKLAEITKTPFDTVVVALELFKKIGLIQMLDNGEIFITQLNSMVGSETSKAALMRNKRARDKQNLIESNNVTNALPNRYTEKEKEKEKEKELEKELEKPKEKIKRFTPPTRQEVEDYINEKGYNMDAERFIDYYTANGWYVGKNKMKDWRAAVRNWNSRNKQQYSSSRPTSNTTDAVKMPQGDLPY